MGNVTTQGGTTALSRCRAASRDQHRSIKDVGMVLSTTTITRRRQCDSHRPLRFSPHGLKMQPPQMAMLKATFRQVFPPRYIALLSCSNGPFTNSTNLIAHHNTTSPAQETIPFPGRLHFLCTWWTLILLRRKRRNCSSTHFRSVTDRTSGASSAADTTSRAGVVSYLTTWACINPHPNHVCP